MEFLIASLFIVLMFLLYKIISKQTKKKKLVISLVSGLIPIGEKRIFITFFHNSFGINLLNKVDTFGFYKKQPELTL